MSQRHGSEAASSTIWAWRDRDPGPRARKARIGGVVRGLIGSAVGGIAFGLGRPAIAVVAWSLSAGFTLLALASPLGAYASVTRWLDRVGKLVGRWVGWVLLTPVYLFFFVPFRFAFRLGLRDRMTRRIDPNAESYWQARTEDRQVLPMKRPY